MRMTPRQSFLAGASLPFAAGAASTLATPAAAAGHDGALPTHRDFTLGDFRVATLLAGSRSVPEPQGIFGMNVSTEEFAEVSARKVLPTDAAQFFFTPTVVNTGSEVILFDTGLDAGGMTDAAVARCC